MTLNKINMHLFLGILWSHFALRFCTQFSVQLDIHLGSCKPHVWLGHNQQSLPQSLENGDKFHMLRKMKWRDFWIFYLKYGSKFKTSKVKLGDRFHKLEKANINFMFLWHPFWNVFALLSWNLATISCLSVEWDSVSHTFHGTFTR
jgi:hypothetical protein